MTWVDVVVILIVFVTAIIESFRGFIRALVMAAGLLISEKAAFFIASNWGASLRLFSAEAANQGFTFAFMFVLLGILSVLLSRFIGEATQFSVEPFDNLLGCVVGVVSGIILAHAYVHFLTITYPEGTEIFKTVMGSRVGKEVLTFQNTTSTISGLFRWGQEGLK